MRLTGASLIGGRDVPGTGAPWRGVAAATGEPLGPELRDAGPDQVTEATHGAAEAARAFRATRPDERAALLEACAEEVEALGDELVSTAVAETGLPEARITGERARACGQLRLFAAVARSGDALDARVDPPLPDRTLLPRPDLRSRRIAVGPVAVFGASNFPLAFSVGGGDTASALAAGCPVLAKAHPAHPGTSELVGRAISAAVQRCGLPAGIFSMLVGRGTEVGQALAADPRIAAIGFTGSRRGGLALVATASARPVPVPVYAEMSSTNPVLVLPGALDDPASLAEAYVTSLTMGSGQFCTNPGLLLLPSGERGDRFLAEVARVVREADGQVMLSPGIATAYQQGTAAWRGIDGTDVVAEGRPGGSAAQAPVVVACSAATYEGHTELRDEVFGAAGLVVRWSGEEELLRLLDRLEGQLTATIHGGVADTETARRLLPVLEERAGRLLWGGWPTGVEVCSAMVHGGPFPATSAPATTSVGTRAIERWLRPVCYQSFPPQLLPRELRDENPDQVSRLVDGRREGR